MIGDDRYILDTVLDWHASGRRFHFATVLKTWGASPRPAGAWMAWRDDGAIVGSLSGGCIEDALLRRWRAGALQSNAPQCLAFGGAADPDVRLPCGAVIEVLVEPVPPIEVFASLRDGIAAGALMRRRVDIVSGEASAAVCGDDEVANRPVFRLECGLLETLHGPRWRVFIVGASDLGRQLASLAASLDFAVTVCDPRQEYVAAWTLDSVPVLVDMPDDALAGWKPDARSAIVAVSHDPKIDDLVLIDGLKTPAFYIAAVGSQATSAKRRERLALFDLAPEEVARLHAPAGLPIGSRTPAEIALSILAEMVAERRREPEAAGSPACAAADARDDVPDLPGAGR